MTCVTLSSPRPWSDSTSPMPCSKDRRETSCVTRYLWKTPTASQVRKARHFVRLVKEKVAVKGINIFPCPYCMGLGSPELHKRQP